MEIQLRDWILSLECGLVGSKKGLVLQNCRPCLRNHVCTLFQNDDHRGDCHKQNNSFSNEYHVHCKHSEQPHNNQHIHYCQQPHGNQRVHPRDAHAADHYQFFTSHLHHKQHSFHDLQDGLHVC